MSDQNTTSGLTGAANQARREMKPLRDALATYQPDPAEEEWYASPAGLRSSARQLRVEAQHMIRRADALDAKAAEKEASDAG